MSTYAKINRLRKLAHLLYLEVMAPGIELRAEEDPKDLTGYTLHLGGLRLLSQADHIRQRVEENKVGLMRVVALGKWDGDLGAVRGEGAA